MKFRTIVLAILLLAVVGLGAWLLYKTPAQQVAPQPVSKPAVENGNLYLAIADDGSNLGGVSAVQIAIDKVSLHSQSLGWVTVSQLPQTFSLLELKSGGKPELVSKSSIAVGTYDQVWFHIANVMVAKSTSIKTAAVPSNDFKMDATVKVVANADSTATIDIDVDKSLHKTSSGEFIFAPVVNFESRSSATVNIGAKNLLDILGGTVDSTVEAGMDASGQVKSNFSGF